MVGQSSQSLSSKICTRCALSKPLDSFGFCKRSSDGRRYDCKECRRAYYLANRDTIAAKAALRRPEINLRTREARKRNPERFRQYDRERYRRDPRIRERCLRYYYRNKDKVKAYYDNRRKTDIQFRLALNLRTRLNRAIKIGQKSGSAVRDLGCSIPDLKIHLENQFAPGMSWANYGEWHIDHISPLSRFDLTDPVQFQTACHYTNLQPLWAAENIAKSDYEVA